MKKNYLKSLVTVLFLCTFTFASSLCLNYDALAKISKQDARHIALSHAGVAANRANFDNVDFDPGKHGGVYEVKFHTPNRRFSYTISAKNGKVLNHSSNKRKQNRR